MPETLETLIGSAPDLRTAEIYDVYQRASKIYERTNTALGRSRKTKISVGSTSVVELQNVPTSTSKILNR
jgi:hypothetical protein